MPKPSEWVVCLTLLVLGGTAAAERCPEGAASAERATPGKRSYEGHPEHGEHGERGAIDARDVVWRGVPGHAVRLGGTRPLCLFGGRVAGPYPEDAVYECTPEHCAGGRCPEPCWGYHLSAGISVRTSAQTVIEDVLVSDYGDGISQESSADRAEMVIRRAYLHDLHDDAIENDWGATVRVEGSLIERVFMAFASRQRSSSDIDARDRVFEVRNNLVLLHEFTNSYKQKEGHGGFWKWGHEGRDPRFIVTDNVFVAHRKTNGLLFPLVDQVIECRNNKLLWAGTARQWEDELGGHEDSDGLDARGRMEALSHCYTVIMKPAEQSQADFLAQHWDPLVAEWKATHEAAGGTPNSTPVSDPAPDAPPQEQILQH
jgi:hypothetical protein